MSDIEIANSFQPKLIEEIAEKIGIARENLEHYGKYKAKIPAHLGGNPNGKLILVTAMTPTPAGEGKTTVSIGLADAMNHIGAQTTLALREPSLGPVFGIKGGATGGGYSQVIPMEEINLHFNGDFSAVEKANNLLAALIDNNLQSKNRNLDLDPRTIRWKRVMDMNDRSLRDIVIGLGGKTMGVPREAGFDITAASEIMAILCLAENLEDLKNRFARILVGLNRKGEPVYARDLNAQGAMATLLKEAINPNLVQTLEGTPALIHGGPFANIAQGTNTLIATKMAMTLSDFTVTEAGFGSDLGAEKFLDIKCRSGNISPSAIVMVATIRALKYHGGVELADLQKPDVDAVKRGIPNLERHLENGKVYGVPTIVAVNRFTSDSDDEVQAVIDHCKAQGIEAYSADYWKDGGKGGTELAEAVVNQVNDFSGSFTPVYNLDQSVEEKVNAVAKKIYGAGQVDFAGPAKADMRLIERLGLSNLPICIAKTQSSLSDDPKRRGRPEGFGIEVREIEIAAGAGFLIPITGKMMRMPGLPETPASENIDIDKDGKISGLF
ncbi:formate--tetrahydrofolate ligase [Cryomorphaceae bacterium 1068]|nr:formate--tetrahydrofolate ligase [Cryomorphaceae bacterium 1068]